MVRTADAGSGSASNTEPTIASLINHFDCAQFVADALDGALAQVRPFDEIVVVDDGSSSEQRVRCGRRPVWVGGPTSCLAIRRSILDRIFPYESTGGWRTCADEALVMGGSMAGARKYQLGASLVNDRVHGANAWFGRSGGTERMFERRLGRERLCETISRRLEIPHRLEHLAHEELRTIERPTRAEYREYQKHLSRGPVHWRVGLRVLSALFAHDYFGLET